MRKLRNYIAILSGVVKDETVRFRSHDSQVKSGDPIFKRYRKLYVPYYIKTVLEQFTNFLLVILTQNNAHLMNCPTVMIGLWIIVEKKHHIKWKYEIQTISKERNAYRSKIVYWIHRKLGAFFAIITSNIYALVPTFLVASQFQVVRFPDFLVVGKAFPCGAFLSSPTM